MTIADLVFLASGLTVLVLLVSIGVSALMRRFKTTRRLAWIFAAFVTIYAVALISTSLTASRHTYPPGERRCYDDWCIAAVEVKQGGQNWIATLEVSSDAKRVRQRAPDARVELEDQQGRRYQSSAPLGEHALADELGPGEAFRVLLPFQLPNGAVPAGIVSHHGDGFPGVVIIGDDSSFLHPRSLLQFAADKR